MTSPTSPDRNPSTPQPKGRPGRGAKRAPAQPSASAQAPAAASESKLPWVALGLSIVVILFHAAFAYTSGRTVAEESETSTSVLLFISLIMSLIVVVVSTVALSQKCKVRWASLFSLGVGVNVLVVCIASWVGGLAAATP